MASVTYDWRRPSLQEVSSVGWVRAGSHDAMDRCGFYGPPNIFVTFTCNTKWREITDALRYEPGQQPCDQSDLIVRVFNMKVDEFIDDIREGRTFGPVRAVLYAVEFEKCGMPNIHCLVWLVDACSEFSTLTSSATPAKIALPASEPPETPQCAMDNVRDEISAPSTDMPGGSSTKRQKSTTKKRSRPSPNEKVSKKLFTDEEIEDGNAETGDDNGEADGGAGTAGQDSPSKDA